MLSNTVRRPSSSVPPWLARALFLSAVISVQDCSVRWRSASIMSASLSVPPSGLGASGEAASDASACLTETALLRRLHCALCYHWRRQQQALGRLELASIFGALPLWSSHLRASGDLQGVVCFRVGEFQKASHSFRDTTR